MRLQLHALAYNLANFLRSLALPQEVEHWSLTTLREKLVKIGARIVRHGRSVSTFAVAETQPGGSGTTLPCRDHLLGGLKERTLAAVESVSGESRLKEKALGRLHP